MVQDLATQWIQSYPCKTKTSQETQRSSQKFLEPNRKPKVIHLHWQFLGTWQSLWRSLLESLHVDTTQIRNKWDCWESSAQSKEGTSEVLLQWGLNENWLVDSMECVKSIPPYQKKWLRKRYDENDDHNMSNETKRETNYSMNNKWNNTRNMHITWAWTQSAHSCTLVHLVSHLMDQDLSLVISSP